MQLSDRAVRGLRVFALITGLALILLSLFADRIGLSVPGRPSRNQVMIAVIGLGLLGTAILGRRTPRAYKGFGLLLANLVLVFLALELLSLFIIKITPPPNSPCFAGRSTLGCSPIWPRSAWHGAGTSPMSSGGRYLQIRARLLTPTDIV